jgi:hypothetical protein
LGNPTRRDLLLTALELMRIRYRFAVIGYVVMPEHVHLLISEPFNWRSLEDNSGIRRSGIGSDQRLDLVGGENSTERWLSVGRVSAKIPTSRKEREKWGTRREMGHPAFPFYFALCRDAFGFSAKQLCPWRMLCAVQTSNSR